MGITAEKLRRQLSETKAGRRATPISNLRRLARRVQKELGPAKAPRRFRDYHPTHAVYLAAQNLVSYLDEEMSTLREMWEYNAVVGQAEDEYLPNGPPFSPLTGAYFTTWAFFDASFGRDRETIGTCLLDIGPDLRIGELWYVRILPPPFADSDDSLVFTTPYHLIAPGKKAWTDFLNRTMAETGLPISRPASAKTGPANKYPALEALMKYGLHRNYWHEFLFQAISITGTTSSC